MNSVGPINLMNSISTCLMRETYAISLIPEILERLIQTALACEQILVVGYFEHHPVSHNWHASTYESKKNTSVTIATAATTDPTPMPAAAPAERLVLSCDCLLKAS